jgi:membrane protease YdiL (CAAX protease family)
MLFMLALLPAICEEIFFRGMLLYGLRGRLSPVRLALVNGLVFGLFHVALFRILPAGYLGVVLAAVTLITGSIFPAMLWHALNNGFVLLMGRAGFPLEQLDSWMYALAGAILLCALWLLKQWSSPRGADARQPQRHRDRENG